MPANTPETERTAEKLSLFQNLRSSRETELAQEYSIHLVTAWLENTPKVAMEHYLQVRDEDFAKASGGHASTAAPNSAAQALQNSSESLRKTRGQKTANPLFRWQSLQNKGSMKTVQLPVLDTYRNFLAKPSIEGLLVLKAIRTFEFAA
ncbi:MAG: hypothetical protein JSS49_13365 [Planctomycetes bacterium]|nr:hypothetical protein [Planctomycetota bacterium]